MKRASPAEWIWNERRRTIGAMSRTFAQRIHNPRNRECACDPDCWCQRTRIGRAVKWWFPGRVFGLHHKNRALAEWKRQQGEEALADWKREKDPNRPK